MEAIGLNPIRLDAIGIDPIRLNAIRLGVPGASSGSNRPYIDPEVLASLVAVCICDGKSNNDPDRAVIKNLVDPDNPFVISNAAYKMNSGYGKYAADFTDTVYNKWFSTFDSFSIEFFKMNQTWRLSVRSTERTFPSMKVSVKGIMDGDLVQYHYYDGSAMKYLTLNNGENTIPDSKLENGEIIHLVGFWANVVSDTKITITQIPSFQGALVTDGVDDLIVSQKTVQEMLGGSNEITVVSMTHLIDINHSIALGNTNYVRVGSSFIRNSLKVNDKTGIYGWTCSNSSKITVINNILGDKNDYGVVGPSLPLDSVFSVEGYAHSSGVAEVCQVAWYWTFIANRVLTTDEINQVIAYYNLDKYVKPDILCNTIKQGITNENHAEFGDKLIDFSGNGRDIQLNNIGWNKESGIDDNGALCLDGVNDFGKVTGLPILKDYTVVADIEVFLLKGGIVSKSNASSNGAFIFNNSDTVNDYSYSFGAVNSLDDKDYSRKILYQSKYIYNGSPIQAGTGVDSDSMWLGTLRDGDYRFSKLALWSFLLFPYTLSEFLLERQLKRYKLGTLYPDMVEFRPIVKSNVEYELISFATSTSLVDKIVAGDYMKLGTLYIYIKPKSDNDRVIDVKINGIPAKLEGLQSNGQFRLKGEVTKSPQKIDITIDEYIRYEDIVQPYPFIIPIIDTDGKEYTYGDKIKVGTEIRGGINGDNLLPELYKLNGYFNFNGAYFSASNKHVIGKTNVFELTNAPTYLKANEPNCIADPQRLRIPNSSYKILGYIPDISGHGNHLKINNSAYAGMSGANGYSEDFTTWLKSSGVKVDNDKIEINASTEMWLLRQYTTSASKFKVNVVGIPNNGTLKYGTISNPQQLHNGINELDAFSFDALTDIGFFKIGASANDWIGLIIQQIGEYEGSFCLDGVEDYLTIPTLSHGAKQVLMKVNVQSKGRNLYDQRGVNNPDEFQIYLGDEVAYIGGNNGTTYIDGIVNNNITGLQLLNITHNITITNSISGNYTTISPRIGTNNANNRPSKMALFAFMSFDDISSEEEIKELNDIVGIEGGYVESPDYYWDAYGKSNSDADRATIIDQVSKEAANALTANNFAFNEESGYNGNNGLVSDGVEDYLINANIPAFTDFTVIAKRRKLSINGQFMQKGLTESNSAFLLEKSFTNTNSAREHSFGGAKDLPYYENDITLCTKTHYNDAELIVGSKTDSQGLLIGKTNEDRLFWKGVFYKMMLYSKTIDMLSINMLKNLFEKDELIDVNNPIFKQNN